jgi:hypothetical protein
MGDKRGSTSKGEKCGNCNKQVRSNQKGLLCESYCGKWFNADCLNIDSEKYEMIGKLGDLVLWFCPSCRANSRAQLSVDSFSNLENKINSIGNNVNMILKKVSGDSSSSIKTYADCVENFVAKNRVDDQFVTSSKAVVIKPKCGQSITETKNAICSLKLSADKIPIMYIRGIKAGGVIVKTDEPNADKLLESIGKKLLDKFVVSSAKRRAHALYSQILIVIILRRSCRPIYWN